MIKGRRIQRYILLERRPWVLEELLMSSEVGSAGQIPFILSAEGAVTVLVSFAWCAGRESCFFWSRTTTTAAIMLAASLGAEPERMEAREMLEAFEADRIAAKKRKHTRERERERESARERWRDGKQPVSQDGRKGSMRTWSGLGRHKGASAIS